MLVIGIGNSGGDLAADISRVAEKVHNSFFFQKLFLNRAVLLHIKYLQPLTVFFKTNVGLKYPL